MLANNYQEETTLKLKNNLSKNVKYITWKGGLIFPIWKRAPIISGFFTDKEFDLDKESDLIQLGLNPSNELKIADKYVHYQNCSHAVIEFSTTLRKGIEQVESTIKRLLVIGKKVDFPIIVVNRLSSWEQRFFRRKVNDKIMLNRETNKPQLIKIGSNSWNILLFYSSEVKKMYSGLNKYLPR